MADVTLKVELRQEKGKQAAGRLRRAGKVPAVVYGKSAENVHLQIETPVLQRFLASQRAGGLVELQYNGTSQTVLVKDVQVDPILGTPLHVDFHAVNLDQEVLVAVPIVVTGEDARESDGGILTQNLRELSVSCLPRSIPEAITVDISGLSLGEALTAGQVQLPEGVTLATDSEEMVLSIIQPQRAGGETADAEGAGDGAADEAAAEGEGAAEWATDGENADA